MILTYYGHAFFELETAAGKRIAFDPYGKLYAYPERLISVDLCLISHHHFDHDGVCCIKDGAAIIDTPDAKSPIEGVEIRGIPTFHDEKGGALRGENIIYIVETEGLRVAHAGDLGHLLTKEQVRAIGPVDVLLLPVGGFFTIDAKTACKVMDQLHPTLTIPMHYQTEYDPEMTIAPLADFLKETGAQDTACPVLRLTDKDMSERPRIMTMAISK